jgi:hypothetical protein
MTLRSGGKWFGGQPIMQDNEIIDSAEGRITIWENKYGVICSWRYQYLTIRFSKLEDQR